MKSLILVRHAKSSWDSPSLLDFDRPLNDRGLRDAPLMAQRLLDRKVHLDQLVSSTAVRALTTAQLFARTMGLGAQQLTQVPQLYHASPAVFQQVIGSLAKQWQRVALFSHNPGITEFVNQLGVARVDDMPTCACFGVHALCDSWADFATADKRFWLFDYPKNF